MAEYYYNLKLLGLERRLPIVELPEKKLWIASFMVTGDTELTHKCSDAFIRRFPNKNFDYVSVPEAKGIPLVETTCQKLSYYRYGILPMFKDYIVLRKEEKSYMENPLTTEISSITTKGLQKLVLNGLDADKIKGKKVYLIDDVVSTGNSLTGAVNLLKSAGADIRFVGAVLREGNFDISNIEREVGSKIHFLAEERLPVFKTLEEIKGRCIAY